RSAAHQSRGGADSGSHRAANGRCDLAEVGVALVADRIREVRVVEKVEEIRAELQVQLFGSERKLLGGGEIEVGQARAIILVPPRGADASGRRRVYEKAFIEGRIRIPVVLYQLAASRYVGTVE